MSDESKPTLDTIYAAWHAVGADVAGLDWAKFVWHIAVQTSAEAHGLDELRRDLIADTREVFDASGSETPQSVRDVIEYVDSWLQVQVGRAADRANVQPKNMTTHTLKTDPAVFADVLSGAKTFEIRFNDRDYQVGDVLQLQETEHDGADMKSGAPLIYTGREVTKTVSHILTGYGLAEGWCCLSFAPEVQAPEGALRAAANAELTRWNSPLWRQEVGTAELMAKLRAALAAPAPQAATDNNSIGKTGCYPAGEKTTAAPQAPVALTDEQIRALRPLPFSNAELDRLYANIPPTAQQDARSREAFKRIARIVEDGHDIRSYQTKEPTNDR